MKAVYCFNHVITWKVYVCEIIDLENSGNLVDKNVFMPEEKVQQLLLW